MVNSPERSVIFCVLVFWWCGWICPTCQVQIPAHPQLTANESSPDLVHRPLGSLDVGIRCVFSGTPRSEVTWAKYSWSRGYEVLKPSKRVTITSIAGGGSELIISSLGKADAGLYQCRGANLVGEASHQISLVPESSVVLIMPPYNASIEEGEEAVFHCKVDGYPTRITYRWFKDGAELIFTEKSSKLSGSGDLSMAAAAAAPLIDSNNAIHRQLGDKYTMVSNPTTSVLVVNKATRKEAGRYACEGSNAASYVRTPDAILSVKFKPTFVNMKSFLFIPMGLTVNVTCTAEANPAITRYSWAKGNNADITDKRFRFSENGQILTIANVTKEDAGSYICFVTNDHSSDKFDIEIQVTDPPAFTHVPRSLQQLLVGDSTTTIACRATATISPIVSWMKDGKPIPEDPAGRVYVGVDGSLILRQVRPEDAGDYLCLAHNVAATIFHKTRLIIEDENRPHPPRNLTVETTPFSATLTWLPAYNRGVQIYVVQYRQIASADVIISMNRPASPAPWQQMRVFPDGALTFTVYNLQPNSTYEFRIMARSHEPGDGLYGQTVVGKTKVAEKTSTTAGSGFGKQLGGSNSSAKQLNDGSGGVGGLWSFPTASAAEDRLESLGTYSEHLAYNGPKPLAPRNLTGIVLPRSINLRWLPPSSGNISVETSPPFTCYSIEYMSGEQQQNQQSVSSGWRQLANVTATTDSFVFSNPLPKTLYRFRIAACSPKTIGFYSDTVVVISEDTTPGVGLIQVDTETALYGVAGCTVVLVVIISVVVVCVRYNRPQSPFKEVGRLGESHKCNGNGHQKRRQLGFDKSPSGPLLIPPPKPHHSNGNGNGHAMSSENGNGHSCGHSNNNFVNNHHNHHHNQRYFKDDPMAVSMTVSSSTKHSGAPNFASNGVNSHSFPRNRHLLHPAAPPQVDRNNSNNYVDPLLASVSTTSHLGVLVNGHGSNNRMGTVVLSSSSTGTTTSTTASSNSSTSNGCPIHHHNTLPALPPPLPPPHQGSSMATLVTLKAPHPRTVRIVDIAEEAV